MPAAHQDSPVISLVLFECIIPNGTGGKVAFHPEEKHLVEAASVDQSVDFI